MFEDSSEENFEIEEDYISCPSCGSPVAVIENHFQYGDIGHCKHDCGYKWYMLIEPNPETFYSKHTWKNKLDKNGKLTNESDILGHDSEIVLFEEDLEDIMYEDKNRYNRIIKYSDLSETSFNPSIALDPDVPVNLIKKRQKFFENEALKEANLYKEHNLSVLDKFLNDKETLENAIYIFSMVCHMEVHYNTSEIIKSDMNPKPSAITYNEYQKAELSDLVGINNVEKYIKKIETILNKNYGIGFFYIKSENDKDDGCRPLEFWEKEIFKNIRNNTILSTQPIETPSKMLHNSVPGIEPLFDKKIYNNNKTNKNISLYKNKVYENFLNKKTTYNKTIKELFEIIKDSNAIGLMGMKPYIISLDEFYQRCSVK